MPAMANLIFSGNSYANVFGVLINNEAVIIRIRNTTTSGMDVDPTVAVLYLKA